MAAVANGQANGVNGHVDAPSFERFSDVKAIIDLPTYGGEEIELDLSGGLEDTEELCSMLKEEKLPKYYWITIALVFIRQNNVEFAFDVLKQGIDVLPAERTDDRLGLLTFLCWVNLWKCRRAPRVKPSQPTSDDRTKEHWLAQATSALNDASRISPSYPPLFLARGTLLLLKASLQPTKFSPGGQEYSERAETLKQASKCFDDAYRVSGQKNVLAVMGKAKVQYSMGKFPEAYVLYQQALERAPDLKDPDPRIGIGCCLWQLGHKENAREAWERALELNEKSNIANILLGLYHLDQSGQYNTSDPAFAEVYKTAMTDYTQTAFKLNDMAALTCATFGGYFLLRKTWPNVERLARRAIENTDVNATASDGWYLLARKDHAQGDLQKAQEHYNKADQARGGDERGYLPAKFGIAQLKTLAQDYDGAKFRLEKMVSATRNVEAMTLLGILHAEEVFTAQSTASKDDTSDAKKKAIGLLEQVRIAWRDSKKKITPDASVLLNLARLYELDAPDKALACLQHVEQLELAEISDEDLPENLDTTDEGAVRVARHEMLSPQLLNNIGAFHFQAERTAHAREYFQFALKSTVSIGHKDDSIDTDALVSTISYNLGRTYEAEGIEEDAQNIYKGLLARHPDYIDANARMAYLALRSDPAKGAEAIKQLMESDPANLGIRALYGWYINKHKKRTLQLNEDQEQRHYKHTLMTYDKHDIYSLTGMGNLHLTVAREMPRDTDQHKEKRSKTFIRAVEFFDKVLALDPKNAYAAQGLGIAMAEDKKDSSAAIQIFSKVRESVKDASVHINLGHVFCELKQYSRSIENYELALAKSREKDPNIMACLGRAWLLRARAEKTIDAYKTSLDFSQQALKHAPDNINFKFNIAFVQIQIAQQMISQPEANKTLADVEASSKDLDAAIESFTEIAKSPNTPFPRHDIEQRANMGRNTMKRQLATAIEKQAEYERKNATRIEEARRRREEEIRKREEEKQKAQEAQDAEKRKLREEREKLIEEDRQAVARRLEEEKMREEAEYTTDAETGQRKKREKRPKEKRSKRKKKGEESDTDGIADGTGDEGRRSRHRSRAASTTGSDGEAPRKKKKRRLERKGQAVKNSKYKSADLVVESDEDDDTGLAAPTSSAAPQSDANESPAAETPGAVSSPAQDDTMADGGDEDDDLPGRSQQRSRKRAVVDDDEDEDDGEPAATNGGDASMVDDGVAAAGGDSEHGAD